ncbi:MAG TPA: ACT domain-containing protein [Bryobacteraceae bacterium]|nr:ACT domain-containing protein [Bryobacteraceae bacterium]
MSSTPHLDLTLLEDRLSVCRLATTEDPPLWALAASGFCSLTRTADEWSVVCREDAVPGGVQCEPGWRIFQVAGPLEFSLAGILASIAGPLADAGVSIFALSTYDTDYVMVKARNAAAAARVLAGAGHCVRVTPD